MLYQGASHILNVCQVADRLSREPNISAIYSSDLKRALETAETIASKYGRLEVSCCAKLKIQSSSSNAYCGELAVPKVEGLVPSALDMGLFFWCKFKGCGIFWF